MNQRTGRTKHKLCGIQLQNKSRIDLNNTTMIATTQTALLLAEMDGDLKERNCDAEKHLNTTISELDLNATGFILQEDNQVDGHEQYVIAFLVFYFVDTYEIGFFVNDLIFSFKLTVN